MKKIILTLTFVTGAIFAQSNDTNAPTKITIGDTIPVYEQPSYQAKKITNLMAGNYNSLETYSYYYKVEYNGKTGYVWTKNCNQNGVITGQGVCMLAEPTRTSTILMKIKAGETVKIIRPIVSDWRRIDVGWIPEGFIKK